MDPGSSAHKCVYFHVCSPDYPKVRVPMRQKKKSALVCMDSSQIAAMRLIVYTSEGCDLLMPGPVPPVFIAQAFSPKGCMYLRPRDMPGIITYAAQQLQRQLASHPVPTVVGPSALPQGSLLPPPRSPMGPEQLVPPGSSSPQPPPGQPGVAISRPPIAAPFSQAGVPAPGPPGPPPGSVYGTGITPQPHVPSHRPHFPAGVDVSRIPRTPGHPQSGPQPMSYVPVQQRPPVPGAMGSRS